MMSMYRLLKRLDANADLRHYFRRRIIRIWPIYFGTLVVLYLLFPYPLIDFIRYLLFFVEYYVYPLGYFPVSIFWTLQLEEAVYLFFSAHSQDEAQRMARRRSRFIRLCLSFCDSIYPFRAPPDGEPSDLSARSFSRIRIWHSCIYRKY